MKLFKLLIIPLVLVLGYLTLVSYPYFFSKITRFDSLGFLSVVEEKSDGIEKTGKDVTRLYKGEIITGKFRASEDNLGIVLVRFVQHSLKVSDIVTFRIKKEGDKKWYYENNYKADQFQPNEYFTFGFPPVTTSKNKRFVFEVESHSGTDENGIGLSSKKPKFAAVYKYSKENLTNFNTLSPFISKKFVYAARNADFLQNWQLLATFALPFFFIFFIKKKKITASGILRFLPVIKERPRQALGIIVKNSSAVNLLVANEAKSTYLSLEKKIVNFSKKASHGFTSTKFYLLLLNTNTKKRTSIGILLFCFGLTYRFSSTLVNQHLFFYAGLGGQSDYDQFIRAATCSVRNFCPAILGQNFLFESSILGVFYEIFGFVGALRVYLYLMIILSSIVATLPYILLSRKHFLTIGGIVGSLYLSTSDYLTHMSLNLPPDNGSLFTFSMFFIVYLLTLHIGTIRWLLFFGLIGLIAGLNKLILLINDLAVLLLFVPVFFFEKAKKINKFPFVKFNPKWIFISLLPFLVFLLIYSAWEYIVQIKFATPYYLRSLIEGGSTYASSTIEATSSINESLSKGNIFEKSYYYAGLSIVMVKRLIDNAGLNDILLTPILLGLLFATFRKPKFFIAV